MNEQPTTVVFVYNADSGYFNMVVDIAHKLFSPATYPCRLCDVTYGVWRIRPEWEAFVAEAPAQFVFLHRDEFHQQYPDWQDYALPAILLGGQGQPLREGVPAKQLNQLGSVAEMKAAVLSLLADKK